MRISIAHRRRGLIDHLLTALRGRKFICPTTGRTFRTKQVRAVEGLSGRTLLVACTICKRNTERGTVAFSHYMIDR